MLLTYKAENGKVTVTGCDPQAVELIIPPEIDGMPVTVIAAQAFSGCRKLQDLQLPATITDLGDKALYGCHSLRTIQIPAGVRKLPAGLCSHCSSLQCVLLPAGLEEIGDEAFYQCRDLRSLELPEGLQKIGSEAFKLCRTMEVCILPDSLLYIGNGAFQYCSKLDKVKLPGSIHRIEKETFDGCESLSELILPDGLLYIGEHALAGCINLHEINLPGSMEGIGREAFYNCHPAVLKVPAGVSDFEDWIEPDSRTCLMALGVDLSRIKSPDRKRQLASGFLHILMEESSADNEITDKYIEWLSQNVSLFYREALQSDNLFQCLISRRLIPLKDIDPLLAETENRPDLRAELLEYRHRYFTQADLDRLEMEMLAKELQGPTIAELLEEWEINRRPDRSCELTGYKGKEAEVFVPARIGKYPVTAIDYDCFSPWKAGLDEEQQRIREKIKKVILPDSIERIEAGAFRGCISLQQVHLPKHLVKIGDAAFSGCAALVKMTIPDSVTEFGKAAFFGCRGLADEKGYLTAAKRLLYYCGSETDAAIPDGIEIIGCRAFEGNENLRSIRFPDSVRVIEESAFNCCSRLETLRIPANVRRIERGAFFACTALQELFIEDGTEYIGDVAFRFCRNLGKIRLPGTAREIGVNAIADTDWPLVSGPGGSLAERYTKLYYFRYRPE